MSFSHEKSGSDPDFESTDTAANARSDVPQSEQNGFIRSIGLLQATAINMTQMCGIGPFITIPIIMSTGVIGLVQYLGFLVPDLGTRRAFLAFQYQRYSRRIPRAACTC